MTRAIGMLVMKDKRLHIPDKRPDKSLVQNSWHSEQV